MNVIKDKEEEVSHSFMETSDALISFDLDRQLKELLVFLSDMITDGNHTCVSNHQTNNLLTILQTNTPTSTTDKLTTI